ncbi:heavy metal-associated isoprenylated plant protein 16 isoform X1 [Eucalyptus grandis]|uniref:Uncharacterized protein n=2 Tax=Eucalyptus grandis TaxID=71139 RepID=A0ACC3M0X4_EUCGR|nr:heavy metal-associated isoprenylated plant protein 16 isoform X1 [Eucalyptus grandis]KAK3444595.1 hypothetical protein EUGRSUZ_A00961 [Eucalyptus grandis]
MAKKKVVVKVDNMNGKKLKFWLCPKFGAQDNRSEALKIAATVPGFSSLSLKGTDRDVIEVTGDEFDAVELTTKLRKNVGHAKLEAVEEVKEKKEEQKPKAKEPQAKEPQVVFAHPPTYIVMESEPGPACCTIM